MFGAAVDGHPWAQYPAPVLLAFDTATPYVTVALHDGERVVAEGRSEQRMKHGEQLAPLIDGAMREAGIVRQDLTAIAGDSWEGLITAGVFLFRLYAWFLPIPLAWILLKIVRRGQPMWPTTAELKTMASTST